MHNGITHEYETYTDAQAYFYRKLNQRMHEEFPDSKWMQEPYFIWRDSSTCFQHDLISQIKDRTDEDELTPDMGIAGRVRN